MQALAPTRTPRLAPSLLPPLEVSTLETSPDVCPACPGSGAGRLAEGGPTAHARRRRQAFTQALARLQASDTPTKQAALPFLKWAGGKSQLLEQLLPLVPRFDRYFEPFLGGGAMYFAQQPARALVSDANRRLITCYEVVRDAPDALLERLQSYRQQHSEAFYYEVRARYNRGAELSPLDVAAMFIYLNKAGYNGLYRENQRGEFNVPYGRHPRPALCAEHVVHAASQALQGAQLRCCTYASALEEAGPGDFIYLDPPYQPVSATARFSSYLGGGFGEAHQHELARCFRRLHERGCKVMLSNSSAELVRSLYRDFTIFEVQATRAINRNGQGRGAVTELVVVNYPIETMHELQRTPAALRAG